MATTSPDRDDANRKAARVSAGGRPPELSLRVPWVLAGIALVLLALGAFLISTAFNSPHEMRRIGGNLAVNVGALNPLDLSSNNTPIVAGNPANPANLVIANKIDSPTYSCALNVSFDGGGHWTQTPIPVPGTTGHVPECYAPDASFGADGTLYVSFVTLAGRANAPHAAWLVTSRDGGQTLSPPIATPLGRDAFQVRVAADPRVPGRVYLVWLKAAPALVLYGFGAAGNPIDAVRSDDGGRNWMAPTQVSAPGQSRVISPAPAFGPRGQLYVLYLNLEGDSLDYSGASGGSAGPPYAGQWQLALARSLNRGTSWTGSTVGSVAPTRRFIVYTPPFPSLAVDPASGRLYVAFENAHGGHSDVNLWTLAPGARSWSSPVRVNDTPVKDATEQYLPKVAVAPNGRVDIVYYDRRGDPTNVLNQVSLQSSYDHGKTFSRHIVLSNRPFSSRIGFGADRGLADLGGTLGLVSTANHAMAAWADTRAGTLVTLKQDIARQIVAFNSPERLSAGLKAVLRIAAIALVLLGIAVMVMLGRGAPPPARSAARD
ncbi:MAG: glycoside hydrolase [Actinomycetota bacterium]|nr:glycoside hydrolase [Actinomycetota bacterium]